MIHLARLLLLSLFCHCNKSIRMCSLCAYGVKIKVPKNQTFSCVFVFLKSEILNEFHTNTFCVAVDLCTNDYICFLSAYKNYLFQFHTECYCIHFALSQCVCQPSKAHKTTCLPLSMKYPLLAVCWQRVF